MFSLRRKQEVLRRRCPHYTLQRTKQQVTCAFFNTLDGLMTGNTGPIPVMDDSFRERFFTVYCHITVNRPLAERGRSGRDQVGGALRRQVHVRR
jgi:hypothetical protein